MAKKQLKQQIEKLERRIAELEEICRKPDWWWDRTWKPASLRAARTAGSRRKKGA
jgi:hypothetical protein